ncbi:embryonic protein UVS.2-like [Bufo gargarizans]|uniref:embryonic protein UVS.2-like n=1 Tax=Bufo gargarizans TaxID=30331 RepID=UPI001CF56B4F|nr:embryonic protein UVS.2-like [Bufo gargarizans]
MSPEVMPKENDWDRCSTPYGALESLFEQTMTDHLPVQKPARISMQDVAAIPNHGAEMLQEDFRSAQPRCISYGALQEVLYAIGSALLFIEDKLLEDSQKILPSQDLEERSPASFGRRASSDNESRVGAGVASGQACGPKTENTLNVIKKIAKSGPDTDSKASEEPEGTFAKIIQVNKENGMDVHQGDLLKTTGRSAMSCTDCLWPKSVNGTVIVPYSFSSNYSSLHLALFKMSMDEFETLTCVRFVPRTTEMDYINIVSSQGMAGFLSTGFDADDTDSKASEEPEGTFAKIIQVNKENGMDVHQGDLLKTTGRSAMSCTDCLWPKSVNGTVIVPYSFSSNYSSLHLALFKMSMDEFETLTCVRFVPRTTEMDYINIVSSQGCVSYLGRIGGSQRVGLDISGCMNRGTIQHELNHALGFYHEQTRSDRDNYVTIMFQNIAPDYTGNFNKQNTNNLGLEYDFGSVMHYNKFAFSNNSGEPTIVTKPDPNIPIGQINGLSVLDVSKINRLYQCNACAYLLNEKNGSLTSANYPSAYPNNASCVWLIRTPSNQVALNFVAFDVQSSPNCISDYIRIYDGPTKRDPLLLDRTCGTGLIPPIIASTNQLLVEFSTDSSGTGVGFKALYSTVKCGGTFYTPERNFTTPGYPNSYRPNMNCNYTITAPVGKKISLTVTDFQTEGDRYCLHDYLKIVDGSTWKGPFCGNRTIPSFTSGSNTLLLTFVSDGSIQFKGFQASYKFG